MNGQPDSVLRQLFSSDISRGVTHYSLECGPTKLHLPNENVSNFWSNYCHLVSEEEANLYIAENLTNQSTAIPIVINISFKVDYNRDDPDVYDNAFIKLLVYSYQEVIRENIRLNAESDLICVVLDYPESYIVSTQRLLKLRLQFPYCKIDTGIQQLLKSEFMKKLRLYNISSFLLAQPIENWDDIIQTPKECLLMYGSKEAKNDPVLKMNCIFGPVPIDEKDDFLYDHADIGVYSKSLAEVFNPQMHCDYAKGLIDANIFITDGVQDLTRAIPLLLSIGYWSRVNILLKNDTIPQAPSIDNASSLESRLSPYSIITEMMPLIDSGRFKEEHYFLNIGKAIKNSLSGDEGFEIWKQYNSIYPPEKCLELWSQFELDGMLTYKTIVWFARSDSPEKYNQWHDSIIRPIMKKALQLTHADVGYAIYMCNWLDMCCVRSGQSIEWYNYYKNHWRKCGVEEIKRRIINEFTKKCEILRSKLSTEVQESTDTIFKTNGETLVQAVSKLISKIKTVTFLNGCVSMSTLYFMNDNFDYFEHRNKYLTAFNNCVFEVYISRVTGTMYLARREGKPEDYITITTGRNYEIFSASSPYIKMYDNFISKIIPDPEERRWFECFVASGFIGGNVDKILPIWVGKLANNGKTTLINALNQVFGPLCIRVPTTLLTGKRGKSNEATSELIRFKFARFAIAQEPSTNEEMRSGPTKELTGNDPIYTRANYKDGCDIENQVKLIMVSNNDLPVDFPDRALENRIRVLPFLSVFSEKAPESEEIQRRINIYKLDKTMETKLPNIAKALAWKAVETFEIYAKEGLPKCKIIDTMTENYWSRNDQFKGFFRKYIEKVEPVAGCASPNVGVQESYDKFKAFLMYNNPSKSMRIPAIQIFIDNMVRSMGEPVDDKWFGFKFRVQCHVNILAPGGAGPSEGAFVPT